MIARGAPTFVGSDTFLPNGNALRGIEPHCVVGGDVKRLDESVKVSQYLVATELRGGVGVDSQHLTRELGTGGRSPGASHE